MRLASAIAACFGFLRCARMSSDKSSICCQLEGPWPEAESGDHRRVPDRKRRPPPQPYRPTAGPCRGEAPDAPDVDVSAVPDARWVKKRSKSTLGFKGFARADEEGYIDRVHTTPHRPRRLRAQNSTRWRKARTCSGSRPERGASQLCELGGRRKSCG